MDKEKEPKVRVPLCFYRVQSLYDNDDALRPKPLKPNAVLDKDWRRVSEYCRIASLYHYKKPLQLIDKGNQTYRQFKCYDDLCPFKISLSKSEERVPTPIKERPW